MPVSLEVSVSVSMSVSMCASVPVCSCVCLLVFLRYLIRVLEYFNDFAGIDAEIAIFSGVLMILPKFSTDNLSRNFSDSCFQKKNIEITHLAMGTRSDQLPEVRCRTTFTEAAGRCTQELPARLRASSRLIQ